MKKILFEMNKHAKKIVSKNWNNIIKFIILIPVFIFTVQPVCAGADINYNWNGTHLIVNITSPEGVGSAQVKLNISSDLAVESAGLSGFMTGAEHYITGTEHRWVRFNANGDTNGVLIIPINCTSSAGSYQIKLVDVNIKDTNNDSIQVDTAMPMEHAINCGNQETASINYNWNETHLIVNITSPRNVGSAQVNLNISSDLITGNVSSGGFMAGASHIQNGTEHRWVRFNANGDTNGFLIIPINCTSAAGSYQIKLVDVNIKDTNNDSIQVDTAMPMYQTIDCGNQETASINYIWNETHLIVNITSPKVVGSAQVKLNISSDLITEGISLGGFMAGALPMQFGTEHRWFQSNANGDTNGVLVIPIICPYTKGPYGVKLIDVNIKDTGGISIPINAEMPMYQTINCIGNFSDLTVTNITFTPQNPIPDEQVNITVIIKNLENVNLNLENVNVSINISDNFTEWRIVNLTNKTGVNVTFNRTFVIGRYNITAAADPGNEINEMNETNNEWGMKLFVYHECDLNCDGIYTRDWNDLASAYKCFLGIEKNCKINYRDWANMKREYNCFTNNNNEN